MTKQNSTHALLVQGVKRLIHRNDGGVVIIVAVALPILLGFGALALDYGTALLAKTKNQRTSDLAAYAGGLEFKRVSSLDSVDDKRSAIEDAVRHVATKNGASSVVPTIDPNFEYIEVTILEEQSFFLSRALLPNDGVEITSTARVSLTAEKALTPCFHASEEIRFNGAPGEIVFPNCGLTSNDVIDIRGSTQLETACGTVNGLQANAGGCKSSTIIAPIEDPFTSMYADLCSSGYKESFIELSEPAEEEGGNSGGGGQRGGGQGGGGQRGGGQGGGGPSSYELKPGPLCLTASNPNGKIKIENTFKSKAGESNVIIVNPNVTEIEFAGNEEFVITAFNSTEYPEYEGVALYAPSTDVVLSGNVKVELKEMNCFGVLVNSLTVNGGLDLSANCNDESRFVTSAGNIRLIK